ncbi:MAG: C-GCAxxG-C-C family protein [Desulfobulbaceae bacterium]|jgi:C_GCAxxG_C_C family probable redox protein|nr:C-GCAxxG-C-C family protein [Desulfobulbaceae bacterium]
MNKEEIIEAIRERARGNFSKGFNCAECVLEAALATVDTGLPPQSLKMATGFGGGVGLFGDTCGAIAGAVLAVGAVHGRGQLPRHEDRKAAMKEAGRQLYDRPGLYRLFNQIPNRIEEKYGHTLCRELTRPWQDGQWLCRDHAMHCRDIITDAAAIAAELIVSDKETAGGKPFGKNIENILD